MFYSILFLCGAIFGATTTLAITKRPIEIKYIRQDLKDLEFSKETYRQTVELNELNQKANADIPTTVNTIMSALKEGGF